jgi:hypothetical protein
MNPQERQLVDDLFDRLSQLENAPRDRDATDAIQQGLKRAPNALYPLVQTVLLQDEALKRANARIEELEAQHGGEQPQQQGGFLDSMRGALFGGGQPARGGSVPSVRPGDGNRPQWNDARDQRGGGTGFNVPPPGAGAPPPPAAGGGGGSFLGTAAAAAAGMIGGSLLMNSIGGLMGGSKHGFGDQSAMGKGEDKSSNPWGGDQGKDTLSREAGLNDVGSNRNSDGGGDSRQGFSDQAGYDEGNDDGGDDYDDDDFDGGDSDYA